MISSVKELTQTPAKEFVLDETLQPGALRPSGIEIFENKDGKETLVVDMITSEFKQKNYIAYLSKCWGSHYGVIVTPDILWYMVLCELATAVKKTPEEFRILFTTKTEEEGKQNIIVNTMELEDMPLDSLIGELKKYVPIDVELFLPKFSTSSYMSEFAFYASFADMVSPYYNYWMFACGIPKVKVLGDEADYVKLSETTNKLISVFEKYTEVKSYLQNVLTVFNDILLSLKEETEFFKNMISFERCGSGGEVFVRGWITKLFMVVPKTPKPENFNTQISVVEYGNLSTGKNYKKYVGLFGSDVKDDYLIPEFGYYVNEVNKITE